MNGSGDIVLYSDDRQLVRRALIRFVDQREIAARIKSAMEEK